MSRLYIYLQFSLYIFQCSNVGSFMNFDMLLIFVANDNFILLNFNYYFHLIDCFFGSINLNILYLVHYISLTNFYIHLLFFHIIFLEL
jgi:hypothetical protein